MLPQRLLPAALAVAALAGLSSCGVGPGPDLSGPQGPSFIAAYSGDWVLLRVESDDLDVELREAMAEAPREMPAGGGGMTGRRGGRTPTGGGMTGGRGGGMPGGGFSGAGAVDPEQMRRVMAATQAISRTETELGLTLRADVASLRPVDRAALVLPLSGEEESVVDGDVEYFATAKWTEEGLVIEQKVDGGGRVKDKLHVDEKGRLVMEREIDALRGGKVKGTLLYRRKEG
ncbi:MAG: hypothetical protein PVJ04_16355 [Gemmatimonadota bacterium]